MATEPYADEEEETEEESDEEEVEESDEDDSWFDDEESGSDDWREGPEYAEDGSINNCTCSLFCKPLEEELEGDGTNVARGHAAADEYNTFDDVERDYGVIWQVGALDPDEEREEYGASWVGGACDGGSENGITAELDFGALDAGALASVAAGVGAVGGAVGGFLSGVGEGINDAISGAVRGALW